MAVWSQKCKGVVALEKFHQKVKNLKSHENAINWIAAEKNGEILAGKFLLRYLTIPGETFSVFLFLKEPLNKVERFSSNVDLLMELLFVQK